MAIESNPNLKKIFMKFIDIPKGSHYEVNFVTAPNIDGYLAILSVDNTRETHIYRFWPWVQREQVIPYVAGQKAFDLLKRPSKKTSEATPVKRVKIFPIPKPGNEGIHIHPANDSIKSTESDEITND